MRHTAVSLLINLGANPKQIQERMGHASITTTYDRNGHLLPQHDEALLSDLDAAYAAAAAPSNVVALRT